MNQARSSSTPSATLTTPPELEQTLNMFSSHRTVLGYILLSRGSPASIIRHSGVVFEGEQGRKYASAVTKIVEAVRSGLEEVGADGADTVCDRTTTQTLHLDANLHCEGRSTLHANSNEET